MASNLLSRLAPTPSGYLHLGNALNFALTWLTVRRAGGRLLLRIDDLDGARARPEYVEAIFRDLAWLGIDYDLGPGGPDDFWQSYSQTKRLDLYEAMLSTLAQTELPAGQPLVFACGCSRAQVSANSPDGQYPGTCRALRVGPTDAGQAAWRLCTPAGTVATFTSVGGGQQSVDVYAQARDFVVRRRDGLPAYHVASVADDLYFGVNWVVRGQDLLASTGAQLYLASWLPGQAFTQTQFLHHPLLLGADGQKLSKSAGAMSIGQWRGRETSPARFYQKLAGWLGIGAAPDMAQIADLLPHFELVNFINHGGSAFLSEM
jgi:glutamyl/glutaminyl-tRNA synthetase